MELRRLGAEEHLAGCLRVSMERQESRGQVEWETCTYPYLISFLEASFQSP